MSTAQQAQAIEDTLACCTQHTSCASSRAQFHADKKTQDAVIRNVEILGEAVKHLSVELAAAHPDVEWKGIAGMRDKLVHEYFGVNLDILWDVLTTKLPPFGFGSRKSFGRTASSTTAFYRHARALRSGALMRTSVRNSGPCTKT